MLWKQKLRRMKKDDDFVHDLLYATVSRDIDKVEELMDCGIDPCTPTKDGTSPIHKAAVIEPPYGAKIVSRMLSYGADPNATTPTGLSPLHIAAMWGRVETIDVLLDNGANVSLKDGDDMSPLDYTDEADENKEECIDALTRYRPPVKRKSGCFISKSRYNLNKIVGGDISMSISGSEISVQSCLASCSLCDTDEKSVSGKGERRIFNKRNHNRKDTLRGKKSVSDVAVQTDMMSAGNISNVLGDIGSALCDETLFQTCLELLEENMLEVSSSHIITSTLIDDPSLCDMTMKKELAEQKIFDIDPIRTANNASFVYNGDVSGNVRSETLSDSSLNECFMSPLTSPKTTGNSPNRRKSARKNLRQQMKEEIIFKKDLHTQTKSNAQVFIPISPHGCEKNDCNISLKISVVNDSPSKENVGDLGNTSDNMDKEQVIANLSNILKFNGSTTDLKENCRDHDRNQMDHNSCETYINLEGDNISTDDSEDLAFDIIDGVDKSVASLVQYYEEKKEQENDDVKEVILERDKLTNGNSKTFFTTDKDGISCKSLNTQQFKLPPKQEGIIEEFRNLKMEYDWKDVSDVGSASEFEDSVISIPSSILSLSDSELRVRLTKNGETPGPISNITRKVYQRYLTKLEKSSYRPPKASDKYKDYTHEMRQVLIGRCPWWSKENAKLLEAEMSFKFTNPEKHTWREGTMKTSFNYLLLDPRVTNNLPERASQMSSLDLLRTFLASVFYVGKGKKSRPYEHLYEAGKHEKIEKTDKIYRHPSNKINMIHEIWDAGFGVISLHLFHSVIPVEAFTREACMIEAMGLSRLTNSKTGDFYGDAASWNTKKRRQLGIYLLTKAMQIYILEGERQICRRDLIK